MSASYFASCDPAAITRVSLEAAREFIVRVLIKKSVFQFDAQTVADRMLEADLCGAPQHGLRRLPDDVAIMDLGDIDPRGRVLVEHQTAAVATLDGSRALGPVAATKAIELAMQKAREVGIGAVAVHHSQSLGEPGVYVAHAARHGLIGLCASSYGGAIVAAPGSDQAAVPDAGWACGLPTGGEQPIVVTTPSTAVSRAEVDLLSAWGRPVPSGAALTSDAAATPTASAVLTPLLGELGFGIAFAASWLVGGLAGGKPAILKTRSPASECAEHLLLAMDIARFTDRDRYLERTRTALEAIQNLKPTDAGVPIMLPGAAAHAHAAKNREQGIPIHSADLTRLQELARKLKLEPITLQPA